MKRAVVSIGGIRQIRFRADSYIEAILLGRTDWFSPIKRISQIEDLDA